MNASYVSRGDECNMLLNQAAGEIVRMSAGKTPRAAPAWMRQQRASGVTFLKTLVSDYQILSPVPTFACTLGQQSSQHKSMTLLGRLLCAFSPCLSLPTTRSTNFDFLLVQ